MTTHFFSIFYKRSTCILTTSILDLINSMFWIYSWSWLLYIYVLFIESWILLSEFSFHFYSYLGLLKLKSHVLKWRCTRKETLNWNVKHPHHWLCNWLSCLPLVSQKFSSAPSLQSGSVSHHQLEIRHSFSGHLRNPTGHTEPVYYHIKLVALCLNHSFGFNN